MTDPKRVSVARHPVRCGLNSVWVQHSSTCADPGRVAHCQVALKTPETEKEFP